jgi:Na+-translocating ferredoxin:NAD+ oxidoreductase RnfG subunit
MRLDFAICTLSISTIVLIEIKVCSATVLSSSSVENNEHPGLGDKIVLLLFCLLFFGL